MQSRTQTQPRRVDGSLWWPKFRGLSMVGLFFSDENLTARFRSLLGLRARMTGSAP